MTKSVKKRKKKLWSWKMEVSVVVAVAENKRNLKIQERKKLIGNFFSDPAPQSSKNLLVIFHDNWHGLNEEKKLKRKSR